MIIFKALLMINIFSKWVCCFLYKMCHVGLNQIGVSSVNHQMSHTKTVQIVYSNTPGS